MTTKTEMTLENVCFRYDGSQEAVECIQLINKKYEVEFGGVLTQKYWITKDGHPVSTIRKPSSYNLISPSDYLLLLSAPESQAHLLTDKDLIVGNRFECIETLFMHPSNKVAYTKGKTYVCDLEGCITNNTDNHSHVWSDMKLLNRHFKLASQPPVMEGKKETLQDVIKRVSPFGTMTISNPKMLIALEDFIGQKTSSLQSEVEQLKGLLKEAQPFCGTMLRGKIEHYTSK